MFFALVNRFENVRLMRGDEWVAEVSTRFLVRDIVHLSFLVDYHDNDPWWGKT